MTARLLAIVGLAHLLTAAAPPKVEDAGKAPRALLRYDVRSGSAEEMKLVTTLKTDQEQGDNHTRTTLPPTEFRTTIGVDAADKDAVSFTLTFERIRTIEAPGLERGSRRSLQRAWRNLNGMRVDMAVTSAGHLTRAKLTLPAGKNMPESLREPMQGLFETLRGLQVPLPAEPVGKGARWVIEDQTSQGGVKLKRRTTWTLKRRRGQAVELAFEAVETAPPQAFELENMPAGMTAKLAGVSSTAKGTLKLDLRRLMPKTADWRKQTEMQVKGRAGRKPFTIKTRAVTTTKIEGKRAR